MSQGLRKLGERSFGGRKSLKGMEEGRLEPTWGHILDTWINNMEKVERQLERQVGARLKKSLEAKKRRLNFIKKIILSQRM